MRLTLLIGPSEQAAARFRAMFKDKESKLRKRGIVAPDWNHVRLYAACAAPDAVGVLRFRRGMESPLVQRTLTAEFETLLQSELPKLKGEDVVLAAAQLGNLLHDPAELARLNTLLSPHFDDIRIVAHVGEQATMLCRHYAYAVGEGRRTGLEAELALSAHKNWWQSALAARGTNDPYTGLFHDIQAPPFWLDTKHLLHLWEEAFGKGRVMLRPLDLPHLMSAQGADELATTLNIDATLGPLKPVQLAPPDSGATLTRKRQFNNVLLRYLEVKGLLCPHTLSAQMRNALAVPGPVLDPGSLFAISDHFSADNAALSARFPDLKDALTPVAHTAPYQEADPTFGFRATQYLTAFAYGIRKHATPVAEKRADIAKVQAASDKFDTLIPSKTKADKRLLNRIKVNHQMIMSTGFRPHNRLGTVNEVEVASPYTTAPLRKPAKGSSGNVIVACMKNEAPYIIEWIAYHRAIGVDHFLIYTNDCSDTTGDILDHLMQMGVVEHRSNENWKGNSPQQHALNQALKEPLIKNADWIAHIDVDEFMNVRTGNGTLEDLFAAVPDATNIAMTWRLFGHNGVTELSDDFVIDQFDTCAPKYCPKPHTVWGFKTLFRNNGAYQKISCHRPNKLVQAHENKVKWVNGSGKDMTREAAQNGWRSTKGTVGYDLLQLNHYALRSAQSFLIKRQRGRALHVDRAIGINYWIRMDWSDCRDITIKRNIPRLRAEYNRLMQDATLAQAHADGLSWHKAKVAELHNTPEFAELYTRALAVKLDAAERVAYALSLDMES